MGLLQNIIAWASEHRYLACMNPKGWTEDDEREYQKWSRSMPNWRAIYTPKDINLKGEKPCHAIKADTEKENQ